MNCRRFRLIVHDLGRPGALEDSVAKAGFAHAESCASCAESLADSRSLDGALRALASDAAPEAPFHVEAALLAAFRRSAPTTSLFKPVPRWVAVCAAAGLAAALALALGLTLRSKRVTPRAEETRANNLSAPATENSIPRGSVAPSAPGAASPHRSKAKGVEHPRAAVANAPEWATPFVQLPYADNIAPLESTAIVRLVLPRSALASLGLPVSEDVAGERISAEFLLGEDGSPRAIRVVR
jgi:hypothetical protein